MLFSSTIFLFAFLPIVLALHLLLRSVPARNALLLLASLFFYAWGETGYVALLLLSIGLNHGFGILLERWRGRAAEPRIVAAAVITNLLLLGIFKYANFLVDNMNVVLASAGLAPIALDPVHLPIGISFFTFQALTYVVDVHRGDAPAQRSPLRVALYVALFPQLIAGPIVRYRQVAAQLSRRVVGLDDLAEGSRRFIVGLGKKVLVANTLALPADRIFALPAAELEPAVAWLGIICFTFQIYFDFAGYSDMAIGLGRCFGFHFPENFDWPYLSRSLREFWRRWHMSLSTFFRDYVYIPLGGNRLGSSRTYLNLVAVFFLCGLWHGASWSFVIWGLLHGAFLALERTRFGALIARLPRGLQSLYTFAVVVVAWVFFRADDLAHALAYSGAMAGLGQSASTAHPFALYANAEVFVALALASLSLLPASHGLARRLGNTEHNLGFALARLALLNLVLLLSAMALAAGTHNPFIYFRF